ncbi:Gfo/Idh/MocA family protein, partial [Mycobacterium sp. shizuoka-1]|uniref:Gfo/Idh/MocA family protein n=1 Tax=Mycobacterium sp. shizuoka-1 TaxID=2039281 RepID=UPI001E325C2F
HRLVVVAARDPERAKDFAGAYGVERVAAGYADVIGDDEVDVVYNPLANALHAPWNLAAITAGKPLLTEKPFARNHGEAHAVAEAAAAAGVSVLEGFHYLFHPVARRMFELSAGGELGEVRHVEVRMAMPPPAAEDPRWSLDLAGGALMDLGCYGLHIMRRIGALGLGRPAISAAHASQRTPGVDEWCDVEVRFPSGTTGLSANTMTAPTYSFTFTVVGTKGEAMAHDFIRPHLDDRITVRTAAGTRVEHLGTRPSYTFQLEAFAAHVQHGAPLPIGLDDAVQNMQYVDAAYRAAGMSER